MKKCKICNNPLFASPLLSYKNMPSSAQNFPNKEDLILDMGSNLTIYQCSGCGLIQLHDKPVNYYKEVIRAAAYSPEMKSYRITQFSNFIKKYHLQKKKIIEIGCGKGEYMELMKLGGANCISGIEYSFNSVKACIKNKLNVDQDYIEDNNHILNNAPYECFYILNFLEHVPKLNGFLRGIYNNLTETGIGLVEVPNFNMILKEKLFTEFTRDHLFYFTQDTFNATLDFNGFEVIESDTVWYDYILSAVVRKKKKINLDYFYLEQKNIKDELHNFIDKFKSGEVAVWGAGHQALAVLSMTNIYDKIKIIIDSAPFKQNKFSPATHIPIVAPQRLIEENIKAVIVMAASYSDEVVSIIRQNYNKNIKLAILRARGLEEIN